MIRTRIGPSHRAAESACPGRPPTAGVQSIARRRSPHRTGLPTPPGPSLRPSYRRALTLRNAAVSIAFRPGRSCRFPRLVPCRNDSLFRPDRRHSIAVNGNGTFQKNNERSVSRFSPRPDSPGTFVAKHRPFPLSVRGTVPELPSSRSGRSDDRSTGRIPPAPFGPHPAFSKIIILSETENIPRTRNSDAPNEKRKNPTQSPTRQHLTGAINFSSPSHAPLRVPCPGRETHTVPLAGRPSKSPHRQSEDESGTNQRRKEKPEPIPEQRESTLGPETAARSDGTSKDRTASELHRPESRVHRRAERPTLPTKTDKTRPEASFVRFDVGIRPREEAVRRIISVSLRPARSLRRCRRHGCRCSSRC